MDGCQLFLLLVSGAALLRSNIRRTDGVLHIDSGATIFQAAGTEDPILVQLILGAVSGAFGTRDERN